MHGIFKYHIDPQDTVIAILDPPRVGVHYSVIKAIRDCDELKYCFLVACDFEQSVKNILDLCRPTSNKFKGHSFRIKSAGGVDMFPHTKHMEVIIELERQDGRYLKDEDENAEKIIMDHQIVLL